MIPRFADGRIDWAILEGDVLIAGLVVFIIWAFLDSFGIV